MRSPGRRQTFPHAQRKPESGSGEHGQEDDDEQSASRQSDPGQHQTSSQKAQGGLMERRSSTMTSRHRLRGPWRGRVAGSSLNKARFGIRLSFIRPTWPSQRSRYSRMMSATSQSMPRVLAMVMEVTRLSHWSCLEMPTMMRTHW